MSHLGQGNKVMAQELLRVRVETLELFHCGESYIGYNLKLILYLNLARSYKFYQSSVGVVLK